MFTALGNVTPSHLLDRKLYPFTSLKATGVPDRGGDKAFDDDEAESCAPDAAPSGRVSVRWQLRE